MSSRHIQLGSQRQGEAKPHLSIIKLSLLCVSVTGKNTHTEKRIQQMQRLPATACFHMRQQLNWPRAMYLYVHAHDNSSFAIKPTDSISPNVFIPGKKKNCPNIISCHCSLDLFLRLPRRCCHAFRTSPSRRCTYAA